MEKIRKQLPNAWVEPLARHPLPLTSLGWYHPNAACTFNKLLLGEHLFISSCSVGNDSLHLPKLNTGRHPSNPKMSARLWAYRTMPAHQQLRDEISRRSTEAGRSLGSIRSSFAPGCLRPGAQVQGGTCSHWANQGILLSKWKALPSKKVLTSYQLINCTFIPFLNILDYFPSYP